MLVDERLHHCKAFRFVVKRTCMHHLNTVTVLLLNKFDFVIAWIRIIELFQRDHLVDQLVTHKGGLTNHQGIGKVFFPHTLFCLA